MRRPASPDDPSSSKVDDDNWCGQRDVRCIAVAEREPAAERSSYRDSNHDSNDSRSARSGSTSVRYRRRRAR
jgi:hypothetical protein